jgi:16S rRNA (uracil1498-N3)-methyltransferase
MSRFFIDKTLVDPASKRIVITGDDVNHIKNVLRIACGETITLSDGIGTDYFVSIERFEKDKIFTSIIDVKPNCTEPPVSITLFQGIPKSDKMDLIIQKSVELGVKKIVPVITDRTIVKFDSQKDIMAKTARWQRICLEAAKQCNRGIVPEVVTPVKFEKALEESGSYSLSIIPYEKETDYSLRDCLGLGINSMVSLFIGPEGGFTENEIRSAVNHGVKPVTLGPRILRTETAGIAVLSILMYELGDVG